MKPGYKKLLYRFDAILFGWLVNWLYPAYFRPKYFYFPNFLLLLRYGIAQKIFRINGQVKWPVHFTSQVIHPGHISKGIMVDPGDAPGCYINAKNGIIFGSNIEIGPGVKMLSSNHDPNDYSKATKDPPIEIGDHVWIGANTVILPGVKIGTNVIIGAGAVVSKNIPPNTVAVGNPCQPKKEKPSYPIDIWSIQLNRKSPLHYRPPTPTAK
ncbi:MAG: acyltransferase [Lewinellaceae bacterium]|nr:acyltransferase [Lewinellaceae bacterium]